MGMSLDVVPLELLAVALAAVMLSIPLAFVFAGAAISGPRRTWNQAGLGMGVGLLIGVLLAAAQLFALPTGALDVLLNLAMLLGLLAAVVAAVLVIVQDDGTTLSAALAIGACALVALAVPMEAMTMGLGISSSPLVLIAGMVVEAVALAAIVGFLVAGAGRVRALQVGVAAAGIVAALLLAVGVLRTLFDAAAGIGTGHLPLTVVTILALVALVVGSVVGGVLHTLRDRREMQSAQDAR